MTLADVRVFTCAALSAVLTCGCDSKDSSSTGQKKPRPVEVRTLIAGTSSTESMVSAPVGSWKTEEIGMEVGGRIEWVAEPNTSIEGRVRDQDGTVLVAGNPIARIDKERYELQVKSAIAQVARAEQAIAAAKIELEKSLPAQIEAAEAEKGRATIELSRSERLANQNAGTQADVDRDKAALKTADSKVEQLKASVKAKEAEIQALDAQLLQARDSLREAQRTLEDCTLYSSFRGQIAEVSVVPGSVVTAGQAVATIQMMDPIKVEVEVSSKDSRRLRNRQRLPVHVTRPDGTDQELDGYLYLVDPIADSQTRTFTLTLLMMNHRLADDAPTQAVARTDQTWRVDFGFLPGAEEGRFYLSEDAIHRDADGSFVWRIDNVSIGDSLPENRLLDVSKLRITPQETRLPFLGNWVFREITIDDDEFEPSETLIAGKLRFPGAERETWDEKQILFQNEGQWLLRPGDLVRVDLSDQTTDSELRVPMNAVARDGGKSYLFLVREGDQPTVERVEIVVDEASAQATSDRLGIRAADDSVELHGRRYVTCGAHYLRDGEPVRVVRSESAE